MRLKGPPFQFFSALWDFSKIFLSSKGPPFDFLEVRARNIRSKALYRNFWRYIQTIFCKEEAEVRKHAVFMKTSYAYFKTCAFWALDMVPILDVPVLFLRKMVLDLMHDNMKPLTN